MTLTRDQLRAARILLHLHQTQLAKLSMVGVATIRRFEGGQDIGPLYVDALRRAVEKAGAILITGAVEGHAGPIGVGVALQPDVDLPEETRQRISSATNMGSLHDPVASETPPPADEKPRRGRPSKKK